jgi:hypothetical protein
MLDGQSINPTFPEPERTPPRQYTPTGGALGERAAQQLFKPQRQRREGGQPSRRRQEGRPEKPRLGLPPLEEDPNALRHPDSSLLHLQLMGKHMNVQQLGRSQPFGVWALRTGLHLRLQPGTQGFDWFDDVPVS